MSVMKFRFYLPTTYLEIIYSVECSKALRNYDKVFGCDETMVEITVFIPSQAIKQFPCPTHYLSS